MLKNKHISDQAIILLLLLFGVVILNLYCTPFASSIITDVIGMFKAFVTGSSVFSLIAGILLGGIILMGFIFVNLLLTGITEEKSHYFTYVFSLMIILSIKYTTSIQTFFWDQPSNLLINILLDSCLFIYPTIVFIAWQFHLYKIKKLDKIKMKKALIDVEVATKDLKEYIQSQKNKK